MRTTCRAPSNGQRNLRNVETFKFVAGDGKWGHKKRQEFAQRKIKWEHFIAGQGGADDATIPASGNARRIESFNERT
ncbi:hypothetical protein GCM10023220_28680 [Streptomyces ziwulingensis]|uniref:Uncharacterized protein n=1 Tax=Streptomyces ziwulingensis TaxID=1045501 RepID=A0ABP9BUU7_9ACTN